MPQETGINRWWRVVGALLMNLSLGSLYAWSIFVAPLEKEFGWNRAQTSVVFTVAVVVFAASFVLAGRLQDKVGPFRISLVGAVFLSLGLVLASRTDSLIWIYVTLGGIMGFGNGFGYATPIPVLSKWFPDRRGLAVGLAVAGYGAGSAILAFAVPPMLKSVGWRGTFLWLGIAYFVATIIGAFLLKNPPVGWKPAGWVPAPASKSAATTRDYKPGEMIRTKQFPLMWVAYCLGTAAGLMTISQLVPYAKSIGLPATAATLSSLAFVFVAIFCIYYCYGTQLSVFPTTTADFFGTKNLGVNYGLIFTAWGIAGIVGPMIGGKMFTIYHNYNVAFYTAGILSAVAFLAILLANRPEEAPAPTVAAVPTPKGATS